MFYSSPASNMGMYVHVRVFNNQNDRRTFDSNKIEEFPVFKSLKDARDCLFDIYQKDMPHCKGAEEIEIGFIGYSNNKKVINDDKGLETAYESGQHHKDGRPVFYIAKSVAPKKRKQTISVEGKFNNSKFIHHKSL